jgi:hypothetical protein
MMNQAQVRIFKKYIGVGLADAPAQLWRELSAQWHRRSDAE